LHAPAAGADPRLTDGAATARLIADPKVADWLERYPPRPLADATYDRETRTWQVDVWSGAAGEVATGKVDDRTGRVTEAWIGPQVAWRMARGYRGAFGGREINRPLVWLLLSGVFLLGLAELRRPLCMRNLDLLVLLSFSVSLWAFNHAHVFWAAPLAYPPLLYVVGRLAWIGFGRGRPSRTRPLWPVWLLVAATVFLTGFRVGLNVEASNVIDVGYSGVIGAQRIVHGQAPYGHFPTRDGKACGEADTDGDVRDHVQTNGRCESANERGDTYGPVVYLSYVPGYALFGWSGRWETRTGARNLPAAHFTSILFDLLCLAGLALVGLRFGGRRLAATLAFAWAAYPFTQYASSSNTNDALVPAFLIWGFWLVSRPGARGALLALASWTKFAPLVVVPLWARYGRRDARTLVSFAVGFIAASAVAFSVLLLEPDPLHAARVFVDRTIGWQLTRHSPFSIWDWGQYHAAGVPDLKVLQRVLEVAVAAAAVALFWVPRRLTPLKLAALTGALLAAFEVVLTHWSYLYIVWFFPFAAVVLLSGAPRIRDRVAPPPDVGRETRELVAAG
jgi:hypothetical protein